MDLAATMQDIGRMAREAAAALSNAPRAVKDQALGVAAAELRASAELILAANARDLTAAQARGLKGAPIGSPQTRLRAHRSDGPWA
jgi:glutamate-5-semialdehyde dehydrogenase